MQRRSFLGFLLAAPMAAPLIAKAVAAPQPAPPDGAVGLLRSRDGAFEIDFANGRMVMRSDLIADGTITANCLDVGSLDPLTANLGMSTPGFFALDQI
jgi:hypothetical protein